MPANVLVPFDRSSQSIAGLVYTLVSFPDATVTALHVIDVGHDAYGEIGSSEPPDEQLQRAGERLLERATEVASEYDRTIATVLETGIPHRTIVEYTVEHDIDHVVMGSHGESPIVRPFLGHVSEAVVRRVPVSTTIIPESQSELEQRELAGRILVPVDGSEQSLAALEYAASRFPEGQITIFHSVALPFKYEVDAIEGTYVEEFVDNLTEQGKAILASAEKAIEGDDIVVETKEMEYGEPSRSIIEYAVENEYDQIIRSAIQDQDLSRFDCLDVIVSVHDRRHAILTDLQKRIVTEAVRANQLHPREGLAADLPGEWDPESEYSDGKSREHLHDMASMRKDAHLCDWRSIAGYDYAAFRNARYRVLGIHEPNLDPYELHALNVAGYPEWTYCQECGAVGPADRFLHVDLERVDRTRRVCDRCADLKAEFDHCKTYTPENVAKARDRRVQEYGEGQRNLAGEYRLE